MGWGEEILRGQVGGRGEPRHFWTLNDDVATDTTSGQARVSIYDMHWYLDR